LITFIQLPLAATPNSRPSVPTISFSFWEYFYLGWGVHLKFGCCSSGCVNVSRTRLHKTRHGATGHLTGGHSHGGTKLFLVGVVDRMMSMSLLELMWTVTHVRWRWDVRTIGWSCQQVVIVSDSGHLGRILRGWYCCTDGLSRGRTP